MRQTLANSKSKAVSNAIALVALATSLLALGACPGSLSFDYMPDGGSSGGAGASGTIVTSCANATAVLQSNCTGCHASPATPTFANLDLMSDGVAQRLVGVAASAAGMCETKGNLLNRVTLPATGILIDKINFRQTCGIGMPYGATAPLAAADLACLQAWANGLVSSVGP